MKTRLIYFTLGTLLTLLTKTFFSWADTIFILFLTAVLLFVVVITYKALEDFGERGCEHGVTGATKEAEEAIINSKK